MGLRLTLVLSAFFGLMFAFVSLTTSQARKNQWQIAIVPKALTGEYWVRCKKGSEAAAKQFGVKLTFVGPSAETDVDKQIDIVENLITRGVHAIGISPCDGKALVPVIEKAVSKGIPVVTLDSDAKTDKRLAYIGTDNEKAGELAAKELAKLMNGRGKVLIIQGVPGAENLMQRVKGFRRVLAKYPRIEIVSEQACQSDLTRALEIAENALRAHSDLGGIFGVNAYGAPGAAQAVKEAGKTGEVKIVGFDAIPTTLKYCAEGVVQAIVEQRPYRMGYLAVRYLKEALEGKKIPKMVDTGVDIITSEQAKKMLLSKPK
ncbi:MAG: sugar-binding protein [Armatimonadetes bacterium]|nr:sugar-binding protein [Armatimonadota bacterium]MDW8029454.1 sugar-binding protein [Armatimonadota bacterium]